MQKHPELSTRSLNFLVTEFEKCSGMCTSKGTAAMWAQLEKAGMVKKMMYPSPFGHPFNYDITDAGREVIRNAKAGSL